MQVQSAHDGGNVYVPSMTSRHCDEFEDEQSVPSAQVHVPIELTVEEFGHVAAAHKPKVNHEAIIQNADGMTSDLSNRTQSLRFSSTQLTHRARAVERTTVARLQLAA